jgi:integrase
MRTSPSESGTTLAAIRFILLSGFRRNEALGLKPEWLMPAGGVDLPDSKSGPQVRPIGRAAVESIKGQGNDQWVFPAARGRTGHFTALSQVLDRICERATLKGITLHTLRHTFASIAGDLGFSELTIAGLLGHTAGSVTSGYVHMDSSLVAAADRVSAVIAAALDGEPEAKIIPLREERL